MKKSFAQRVNAQFQGQFQGGSVLNAFEILNAASMRWPVVRYHLKPVDREPDQTERGALVQRMWELRRQHDAFCPGHRFVLSESPETVVVPAEWLIPDQENYEGYQVRRGESFELAADNSAHTPLVADIVKRALINHLKRSSGSLGVIWQDFNGFCELPQSQGTAPVQYVRRFEVIPARLKAGRWVLKVHLGTMSIDSRSLGDYFANGDVETLSERIALKRRNRETRQSGPTAIRVLVNDGKSRPEVMELKSPEDLIRQAEQDPALQMERAEDQVICVAFPSKEVEVNLCHVWLILDTQITGEQHRETILSTDTRMMWFDQIRGAIDGAEVHGAPLRLDQKLYRVGDSDVVRVELPALTLKVSASEEGQLPGCRAEADAIRRRAEQRQRAVRQNGYLNRSKTNISPLLAVPARWSQAQGQRLLTDLNHVLESLQLRVRFSGPFPYQTPEDITRAVEAQKATAVLAVLPEGSRVPQARGDMHELIKRQRGMPPSQCVQFDRTLHPRYAQVPWSDIPPHEARRIKGRYDVLVQNLLAKCNFMPFLPAEPFHYNVHVGIDVGGLHNNFAMSCVGYGLAQGHPIFLPDRIEVDTQQVEPIPHSRLCAAIDQSFTEIRQVVVQHGQDADFNRVLFFRDGDLNGQGELWQEIDGLKALHAQWLARGFIRPDASWVVVEVSKRAEFWRQLDQQGQRVENPLVGTVSFPFENPNQALVSTSGEPYLRQGTASPLFVTMTPIAGTFSPHEIIRDLVWEADLCFTQPGIGMSLPYVLHVADQGALHLSKGYGTPGIPL